MLNTLRLRRYGIGRQLTALLLLAWLAVVLQPCAIAYVEVNAQAAPMMDMHDCPHCPPPSDALDYCDQGLCGALSGVHAQEAAPALPAAVVGEPVLLNAFFKLIPPAPSRQFLRLHERTRIPDPPTLAFRVLLI